MFGWVGDAVDWLTESRGPDPEQYARNPYQEQIMGQLSGLVGRERDAPTVATDRADQFRAGQMGLMRQLQGIGSGKEAGAGEMAARRAAAQQQAALQSQAAGARGFGAQAARANVARQSALMGGAAAGQAAQAAMGDQQGALGQLQGLMSGARGQDQATAMANMRAIMQQRGMDDAARLGALGQMQGLGTSEQQMRMQAEMNQQPSRLEQMAGGAIRGLGEVGTTYLTGGMNQVAKAAK